MKIFWSWQSDTPGDIGRHFVRDALKDAIARLKQADGIDDAVREALHLDQDIQGKTGAPDLARTILEKIPQAEVVVADVTLVGKTDDGDRLINSNVAIELGYAFHACTDERTVLVFNKHYGTYEDLPFDLRHKGGAVDFNLKPEASKDEIAAERRLLTDAFVRKLKPFVEGPPRIKEALSLRPIIKHRILQRHKMPDGGTDDVFEINVYIENDGEMAATEFMLALEMPPNFPDNGIPYGMHFEHAPQGLVRWSRTNSSSGVRIDVLHPEITTPSLIKFNGAVRAETKRLHPDELDKRITATVYSGNMKKKQTSLAIRELYVDLS
jgi:hypothetical protein